MGPARYGGAELYRAAWLSPHRVPFDQFSLLGHDNRPGNIGFD
jgi:hypothetical protein